MGKFCKIISTALLVLCLVSCKSDDYEKTVVKNAFVASEVVGVYNNGVLVMGYNAEENQIITSSPISTYIITDITSSKYITLGFGGLVEMSAKLSVEYSAVGVDGLNDGVYDVEVIKSDEDTNLFWLWCSSKSVGFIIELF